MFKHLFTLVAVIFYFQIYLTMRKIRYLSKLKNQLGLMNLKHLQETPELFNDYFMIEPKP